MRTEIVHGIDAVNEQAWNAITAGSPYASKQWYCFGEAVLGEPGTYVLVYDGAEIVGAAALCLYRREQLFMKDGLVTRGVAYMLERNPVLVCRTAPLTNYRGFFLNPNPGRQAEALPALLHAAVELGRELHASYILYDYLEPDDFSFTWEGCIPLKDYLDVGTRLEIKWETFEEYLADMKKRRKRAYKNYGQHVRGAERQGMRVDVRDVATVDVDEALRLFRMGEQKYNMYPTPYAEQVLRHAVMLPGTVCLEGRIGDRLVAFEMLYFDQATGVCTPALFGRDREVDYSYFYMYYEEIRYCIETLHARTIIGNSGVYDFKERLGFTPDTRQNLVFYPTGPVWRSVSTVLLKLMG